MKEKIQRFGGAMFTPVLLFSFSGIVLAISIVMSNEMILGKIASEGTHWFNFWKIVESGAWTVFNQMELLFVIGLAIGLAQVTNARAALEAFVIYLTFNYFVGAILQFYGESFGVDFALEAGGSSGLKMIAGIKTLDTSIVGAIIVSAIVVWIHDRYFNTKLPDYLGVFQGSSFVVIIGFVVMLPFALLTVIVWPQVQQVIYSLQGFLAASGVFGVTIYTFLERILIPTGLHHFIYTPFVFGPAVVEGGIVRFWIENLNTFAASTQPLIKLFPEGGFALHGMSKIFGTPGIAIAIYLCAKPEKKKATLALLIPATITAVLAGITEPLEFTFLFIAPALFAVHAVLAAFLAGTMFMFGVVGDMGGGLIDLIGKNWIPLWSNHSSTYITQIVIGLIFTVIYVVVFRFLILKFNYLTPGREEGDTELKLFTKKDYQNQKNNSKVESAYEVMANDFLVLLGGPSNIDTIANCATRLRVGVKNSDLVADMNAFKAVGAHGLVKNGNSVQVIVGLSVPQVREAFENQVKERED